MSREIKFRAWDIFNKKMLNWGDIFDLPAWEIFPGTPEQRCYEIMQYTGIKDKNGKEIYEGDIVQCTCGNCEGFRYVVNYQNGAFCLNDTEFPIGSWIMNFKHLQDLEVIGNIYENEELLKDE